MFGVIDGIRADVRVMLFTEDVSQTVLVYSVEVVGAREGDKMLLEVARLVDCDEELDKGLVATAVPLEGKVPEAAMLGREASSKNDDAGNEDLEVLFET